MTQRGMRRNQNFKIKLALRFSKDLQVPKVL
jgi:hypothetical protein